MDKIFNYSDSFMPYFLILIIVLLTCWALYYVIKADAARAKRNILLASWWENVEHIERSMRFCEFDPPKNILEDIFKSENLAWQLYSTAFSASASEINKHNFFSSLHRHLIKNKQEI